MEKIFLDELARIDFPIFKKVINKAIKNQSIDYFDCVFMATALTSMIGEHIPASEKEEHDRIVGWFLKLHLDNVSEHPKLQWMK